MTLLFQVNDDIVPATAVEYIRNIKDDHGQRYEFRLRSGTCITGVAHMEEIIANTTRMQALCFWHHEGTSWHEIQAIIAWRITTYLWYRDEQAHAYPILVETPSSNQQIGILDPDRGIVRLPEDTTFESIESFLEEMRARHVCPAQD